ncbi:hypothetical protein Mp_2g15820 [Marchantia polymorpha subsp. ruderalis]|uniref:Uncharacterized protein n=1 Tax=Marchantia polymorpha TaxID=3197 RepID=A0A2R6WK55_MARPO|nr:hypothetical protein MARPO_0082s0077 [Marchantia polymorpha]BBN02502.1 hypothetical protein Mp_2g15820 [Marchantia polymorpha subsp. ruderalis]|eukprot:PTQ34250.1 hypothetical protein MARPO_0082s0077 [Marchantia polymorpha]
MSNAKVVTSSSPESPIRTAQRPRGLRLPAVKRLPPPVARRRSPVIKGSSAARRRARASAQWSASGLSSPGQPSPSQPRPGQPRPGLPRPAPRSPAAPWKKQRGRGLARSLALSHSLARTKPITRAREETRDAASDEEKCEFASESRRRRWIWRREVEGLGWVCARVRRGVGVRIPRVGEGRRG